MAQFGWFTTGPSKAFERSGNTIKFLDFWVDNVFFMELKHGIKVSKRRQKPK